MIPFFGLVFNDWSQDHRRAFTSNQKHLTAGMVLDGWTSTGVARPFRIDAPLRVQVACMGGAWH